MANKSTVTYNGSVISEAEEEGNVKVVYDGKTLAEISAGGNKTVLCAGKIMQKNLLIGGKTILCAMKKMATNIVVDVESIVPPLAQATWAQISEVSRSGQASQYWNIGDTRSVVLSGATYTVQIVAFDHYDVADSASYGRTKAGIVFQFKDAIDANLNFTDTQSYANDWVTNYCDCSEFVPTIKYPALSAYNASSVTTYQKKGINPSEQEIFGTTTQEKLAVGTQFAFYAAGNSKVKIINGTTNKTDWWTRSFASLSSYRTYVNTSGNSSRGSYSSQKKCAPVFCI